MASQCSIASSLSTLRDQNTLKRKFLKHYIIYSPTQDTSLKFPDFVLVNMHNNRYKNASNIVCILLNVHTH